jgi:hypothetical protein
MICINPWALAELTAFALPPLSCFAIDLSNSGSTFHARPASSNT